MSTPVRYFLKKPIRVPGMEFTGYNHQDLLSWSRGKVQPAGGSSEQRVVIHTREGTVYAEPGDFVFCGPRDDFYPIGRAILEETYDEVDDSKFDRNPDVRLPASKETS